MRVNLITQSSDSFRSGGAIPLSLLIRPACGIPGDFECQTDSISLIEMLAAETDLPSAVLDRFEGKFKSSPPAPSSSASNSASASSPKLATSSPDHAGPLLCLSIVPPLNCHPERRRSQHHREPRNRRTCSCSCICLCGYPCLNLPLPSRTPRLSTRASVHG